MEVAEQAAAVCYRWRGEQIEFLLVRTSDGHRWILPKGKRRLPELDWQTAQREAYEEAGVYGEISQQPLTIFRHYKKNRELLVPTFLLKVESTHTPREQQRNPRWFTPEDAQSALSENRPLEYAEEFKRVIREACSVIKLGEGNTKREVSGF